MKQQQRLLPTLLILCTTSIFFHYQTSHCEVSNGNTPKAAPSSNTMIVRKDKWVYQGKKSFEEEYRSGRWNYLDREATERARHAVIISFFYNSYGGGAIGPLASTGTPLGKDNDSKQQQPKRILDVGCGLGTLSDYLQGAQRSRYLGVDFPTKAVELARKIRSSNGQEKGNGTKLLQLGLPPLEKHQFMTGNAETFEPPNGEKYGTIVFNEVLYYTNHKKVLERFAQYLEPDGIIVLSLYHGKINQQEEGEQQPHWIDDQNLSSDSILADARDMFETVNQVQVQGVVETDEAKMEVSFHIEGFRVKKEKRLMI